MDARVTFTHSLILEFKLTRECGYLVVEEGWELSPLQCACFFSFFPFYVEGLVSRVIFFCKKHNPLIISLIIE